MLATYHGRTPNPETAVNASSRALNADINVTPFLDVLLVLIIIFLASVSERKALEVQLPIPCTGGCAGKDTPIVLEVLPHDAFLLNSHPVSASTLVTTLRAVYAGRRDKVIQVAGHRDVSYQTVLAAMDVARTAGVDVIAIPPSASYMAP
jgi:biopolymer transport protein ExbD